MSPDSAYAGPRPGTLGHAVEAVLTPSDAIEMAVLADLTEWQRLRLVTWAGLFVLVSFLPLELVTSSGAFVVPSVDLDGVGVAVFRIAVGFFMMWLIYWVSAFVNWLGLRIVGARVERRAVRTATAYSLVASSLVSCVIAALVLVIFVAGDREMLDRAGAERLNDFLSALVALGYLVVALAVAARIGIWRALVAAILASALAIAGVLIASYGAYLVFPGLPRWF